MAYESDDFYLSRIIAGDIQAYSSLVNKHKSLVFTIVLRICGSREDAEEVAQDVFVKAFNSLNSFKRESQFSTWLYRIAYNMAISKTRKRKIETVELDERFSNQWSEEEPNYGDYSLTYEEKETIAKQALSSLDPEDALLITLFYNQQLSTEEISKITSLSVSNVKVRLFRIRKKLMNIVSKKQEQKLTLSI